MLLVVRIFHNFSPPFLFIVFFTFVILLWIFHVSFAIKKMSFLLFYIVGKGINSIDLLSFLFLVFFFFFFYLYFFHFCYFFIFFCFHFLISSLFFSCCFSIYFPLLFQHLLLLFIQKSLLLTSHFLLLLHLIFFSFFCRFLFFSSEFAFYFYFYVSSFLQFYPLFTFFRLSILKFSYVSLIPKQNKYRKIVLHYSLKREST